VDLRYFGTQGNLEYDLMIAPQKKVPPLVFKVDGADKVEITPDGDLAIYTSLGIFLEKKPQAGQTKEGKKQLIPCSYKITSGNSITINLSKYDLSLPLVIQ
jgi:hypothetical protein